jgi:DNA-directed RNA polymerase subunit RPC12/RpoP
MPSWWNEMWNTGTVLEDISARAWADYLDAWKLSEKQRAQPASVCQYCGSRFRPDSDNYKCTQCGAERN